MRNTAQSLTISNFRIRIYSYYIQECVAKRQEKYFFLHIPPIFFQHGSYFRLSACTSDQSQGMQINFFQFYIDSRKKQLSLEQLTESRLELYIKLQECKPRFFKMQIAMLQQSFKQSVSEMSHPPKPVPPAMPFRYPFPPMPMPLDKMKPPQPNLPPNLQQNPPPISNNLSPPPFVPPRLFNPYMGGYGMFPMHQMGHFPPYMPPMRNSQMNASQPQNSKNAKETEQRFVPPRPFYGRPMPPYFHPAMYMPPGFPPQPPPIPGESAKPTNKILPAQIPSKSTQKPHKKQSKTGVSQSSQNPLPREQIKVKLKEPRHAKIQPFEPDPPKKKKKKELVHIDTNFQRETREKKQSIEKMMDLIMKQRPLRDRVIKIGKQHQAFIPQSFVNEFQYNLKIKLQKKQNLMSRLITCNS